MLSCRSSEERVGYLLGVMEKVVGEGEREKEKERVTGKRTI